MQKKLIVAPSPFLRNTKASTKGIMLDVIIALLPTAIAAVWFFGAPALSVIITCVLGCILSEWVYQKMTHQTSTVGDLSAVVTGLLLAFNMPASAPWWMGIVGSVIAIVLVKQMFGGIGQNFINPALAARTILMLSWTVLMAANVMPQAGQIFGLDLSTKATPSTAIVETVATEATTEATGAATGAATGEASAAEEAAPVAAEATAEATGAATGEAAAAEEAAPAAVEATTEATGAATGEAAAAEEAAPVSAEATAEATGAATGEATAAEEAAPAAVEATTEATGAATGEAAAAEEAAPAVETTAEATGAATGEAAAAEEAAPVAAEATAEATGAATGEAAAAEEAAPVAAEATTEATGAATGEATAAEEAAPVAAEATTEATGAATGEAATAEEAAPAAVEATAEATGAATGEAAAAEEAAPVAAEATTEATASATTETTTEATSASTAAVEATASATSTTVEATSVATPLNANVQKEQYSLWDLFSGNIPGMLGETCKLTLLLGGLYLIFRRVIDWRIPLSFIGTAFILFYIHTGDLYSVLYQLLSGGLILGAFFMATDYVTSPVSKWGRVIMGAGCALVLYVIRFFNAGYPEGCSFAILFMNVLTPLIDRYTARKPFGYVKPPKDGEKGAAKA